MSPDLIDRICSTLGGATDRPEHVAASMMFARSSTDTNSAAATARASGARFIRSV
jgi:hypothetical protein